MEDGTFQVTVERPFSFDVPVTEVGAPGTVEGVAGVEFVDADPVPIIFFADTRNM